MVREARRSGGRGYASTCSTQRTPSSVSSSTTEPCNKVELVASPHLESLRTVASSIMGASNTPLSPSASVLRRLPLAQLRRAAAAVENLHEMLDGSPDAAPSSNRRILLKLVFGERANRVAFLLVFAVAAGALADTDRGLSTEDQERCAKLFVLAALFVHVVLVNPETSPEIPLAVASLLLRLKLLPALVSLLVAARDPERRQAMGRLQEWFRPTVMMLENLMHFAERLWCSAYNGQPATNMLPMTTAALFPRVSFDYPSRYLELAAKLLEAMAQHQYVEQIARTILWIRLSAVSSELSRPSCFTDSIRSMKLFYERASQLFSRSQKLHVKNETTIRITNALRTLSCGPNAQYFAAASTVAQLEDLDGGTLYGMDRVHAFALKCLNPFEGPPSQQLDKVDWLDVLQWSTSFWVMCLRHDLPLQLCIHGPACDINYDALREMALRLLRAARRWGEKEYYELGQEGQQQLQVEVEDPPAAAASTQRSSQGANSGLGHMVSKTLGLRCIDSRWSKMALNAMYIIFRCSRREVVWLAEPTRPRDDGNIETDIVIATEVWSEVVPAAHKALMLQADGQLAEWMWVAVPSWTGGDLPPAPPPNLDAALSAGFVPLLERNLRFMATQQRAAPYDLLSALAHWPRFGRILAYGEPQHVEALLVTAAKLIRRLGAVGGGAAAGSGTDGDRVAMGQSLRSGLKAIQELSLMDMLDWMACHGRLQRRHALGDVAGGGGTSAALRTLGTEPSRVGGSDPIEPSGTNASDPSSGDASGSNPGNPSRRQTGDGGPSADAGSCSGPTGQHDDNDRGSCSMAFAGRDSEQEPAEGRLTCPQGATGAAASGCSSDVSEWADGPALQLLGLSARVAQLWLPAVKSAMVQLEGGGDPCMRGELLQAWHKVFTCFVYMIGAHALAAGRMPQPDWWSEDVRSVDKQQFRDAGAFWRRLLLEELSIVKLTGRILELLMQEESEDVNGSLRNVHSSIYWALSGLVAEFPLEVAARLRDGTLSYASVRQLCSLRGGLPETQQSHLLLERLAVLGSLSPAEAATAPLPNHSFFPGDFDGSLDPLDVSAMLLLGSLLDPVAGPGAGGCLPTCANPACTNMEGDSEAALPLSKKCGRCGQVSYCSGACQWAHWTSGHNEQCSGSVQQRPQQAAEPF